jgi:hypothetical protein
MTGKISDSRIHTPLRTQMCMSDFQSAPREEVNYRKSLKCRNCTVALVLTLTTMCHSTASAHFANNFESCSKCRLARSAPPELSRRTRSSCGDSNGMILRPASSFSLERSASDDSMRATMHNGPTSEPPPYVHDVDDDSEPWEFGTASSLRLSTCIIGAEKLAMHDISGRMVSGGGGFRHSSRIPKLSRTVETN